MTWEPKKMRKTLLAGLMTLSLAMAVQPASAEPFLELTSPDDLDNILVGQTFRVDVRLAGVQLEPREFLFLLNSEVLFPTDLFDLVPDPGWSSGLTPGDVSGTSPTGTAPDGLFILEAQRTNFNALSSFDEAAGSVLGRFSDSNPTSAAAINQNGLFYSFMLQAVAEGTGQIAFDPADSTYFSTISTPADTLVPIDVGNPLMVTVVPEPASLTLILIGGAATAGFLHRRRRADRQAA